MEPVTSYIKVNHQWKACGSFTRNFRRTKSADGFPRDPRTPSEEPTYDDSSDSTTPTQTTNSSSTARDPSQQSPATHSAALQVALEREVEQQQREDENADEMSKQSSLPTGRAFAPGPIPQYITSEQQQSGDSTGSNDSVETQIPLPYHLPNDASHDQSQSFVTTTSSGQQIGNITRPWGTPDLSGTATFQNIRGGVSRSTRSLNPTSAPYVPPGYPPTTQSYGGYGPNASMTSPYAQSAQIGGTSYQPGNPYAQGRIGGGVHLQGPYGGASTMNPYAHFGAAAGMNAYSPYNNGLGLQADSYGASTGVSPAMSNASLAPTQSTYQSLPYGPGTGAGVNAPTGYISAQSVYPGAAQGWASMHTPQNHYQAQSPTPTYFNPANAHRGKTAYSNSRQPAGQSGYGHGHPTSNLATAPVLHAGGSQNAKVNSTHNQKFGGPVLPPSKVNRPPSSPAKSARAVTPASSHGHHAIVNVEAAPTPGPKTQPLDLEFSSEPRNAVTPTLRSRRGQTISNAVTDPARKQVTYKWLDNVPDLSGEHLQGSNIQSQSPPKMLSLLGSGAVDAKPLATINENDPFTGPARARATTTYNNPFAPKPQLPGPYTPGNRLIGPPTGPSPHLHALTSGGTHRPTFEEALHPNNFPFVEICRLADDDKWGVIKIRNIPYGVTRPEILAYLGRNARIINEQEYEPVHIVMERVTSKTLDCYVEFINLNEAVNAVNRADQNRAGGRGGRLGSRHVEVELSSQEQLMKELFPKAKNVRWDGSRPIIIPTDPNDPYNSGFQGFISKEELVMLVKHVEAPQRSPFSRECPQRPFECLISTLLKYPWYMVDHITIEDRWLLHRATLDLIRLLQERIDANTDPVNLNQMLLKRVWRAALKCPGFTPVMKDDIVYTCGIDDRTALELGVPPFAVWWKCLWTIGAKSGIPHDTLLWYIAIIREHLDSKKPRLTLAERAARGDGAEEPKLFGDLDKLIQRPHGWFHFNLAQVANFEWTAIEQVLREILTPALEGRK